jgi:diaminopimelate epimerase
MPLQFTKMQGAGNDFVVLDGVRQAIDMTPDLARRLADRHFGIGADQLLLVERTALPDADFKYRIFNSDGGEVEHCGNGARCFVRFVREEGLTDKDRIRVEICTGVITLGLEPDGEVTVDMGATRFEPDAVPFDAQGLQGLPEGQDTLWPLSLGAETVWVSVVSIGNPHAVQVVPDVDKAPVVFQGPLIERHMRFPKRVNAGFMQIVDRHHVKLRVYERGAGETLACGTGACAAVAAGIRRGLLDSPVQVQARGGRLTIEWDGRSVRMKGPAVTVFRGSIDL